MNQADMGPSSSSWDGKLISTLVQEHTLKTKVQLSRVLAVFPLMQRQLLVADQDFIILGLGRDGVPW